VLGQQGDVLPAGSEGWNFQHDPVEPVIEILPEAPLTHGAFKIPVRRRDHPHIHADRPRGSHGPDLAVGEEPEQHHLGLGEELAYLVEKECSPVGHAQQARPPLDGPGEGPPLVAEELAQEQLAGQGPAVHDLEALRPPAAQPVDRRGQQFLARARLALDQDRDIERPDPLHAPEECLHRGTPADDARVLGEGAPRPPDLAYEGHGSVPG